MPRPLTLLALPLVLLIAGCSGGGASGAAGGAAGVAGSVDAGKALFTSKGCPACHTLAAAGASGTIGPKLDGIGTAGATRKPGMAADAYIKESISDPQAFIAPGFAAPSAMPNGLASGKELDDLVAFLSAQK
jgi:cytochrome c oxidase subunit II